MQVYINEEKKSYIWIFKRNHRKPRIELSSVKPISQHQPVHLFLPGMFACPSLTRTTSAKEKSNILTQSFIVFEADQVRFLFPFPNMTIKMMLKFSAVAVLAAGVVIWRVYGNRSVRVLREEDEDTGLNDLHNEACLPNNESGDVVGPREQLFSFPVLHVDGLRKNLVSAKAESWKSNCADWQVFQRLRTAETLAVGSYGKVLVAYDDNEREIALKSISKEALSFRGPHFISREVSIMSSFKQENLTPLLASFENGSEVNIVMERARYGSVKSLLRRNDDWLEEALVAKIIACVARGLRYMHEKDVIHRDVKPDNLLITQWEPVLQVKICDFGEAQMIRGDEHDDYIGGTDGYCSPEYINGSPCGPSIDIWSLGITMYELLFGTMPFDQEEAIHAEVFMDERDLSNEAKDLIKKMLEKDPTKRPDAKGVLQHPWITNNAFNTE